MDDEKIVELYFSRSEEAIEQTQKKYGHYCRAIAFRILRSVSDAEECEDDAYMRAWDSIPPERPRRLSAFLGRITRNLALDRYDRSRAARRWSALSVAIDELGDVIPDTVGDAEICDSLSLREALNHFLGGLPERERRVFVQRYWYIMSVKEIAEDNGMTESGVKVTLFRTRNQLRGYLIFRGIYI